MKYGFSLPICFRGEGVLKILKGDRMTVTFIKSKKKKTLTFSDMIFPFSHLVYHMYQIIHLRLKIVSEKCFKHLSI